MYGAQGPWKRNLCQLTKMAALAVRSCAKEKSYFLALRSAFKRLGVLSRRKHTECTVELEVGSQ